MKITDEQFVASLGKEWDLFKVKKILKDTKYSVDEDKVNRFKILVSYVSELIEKFGGSIEPIEFNPHDMHLGFTAYFDILSFNGEDEVQKFQAMLEGLSAVSLDTTTDNQICLSVTIPDVFEEIKQ